MPPSKTRTDATPDPERHVHKFNLTDFKAKKADEGAIEIEDDAGETYVIPPPELWPDEVHELSQEDDNVGVARALIGDRYEQFKAAGGNAMLVMSMIAEAHGISVGESSASSGS